jgi:succinate dehydrogenase / fumarate reductase flavoprotein subunit
MTVRNAVQETMTAHVNVFREEAGLEQALADIREARRQYREVAVNDPSRTFNTELQHTLETRNVIDLAETIAMGALAREEFRGAHWRQAHQERKDEEWLKHTMVNWSDGDPEMWYRPALLDGETVEYEPKERSY